MKERYFVNREQIETTHTQGKWTAMFTCPQPVDVMGCPMGRGTSSAEAINDLLRRTNLESNKQFELFVPRQSASNNAIKPTKETFEDGQSFSDGNIVVGIDDSQIVISWNNTEHCKNMVTKLNHQDAVNVYSVLTSALRKQKLLFP